ncbi:MAG: Tm-1-like ATP-binding domain-containing protein [Actinomycetota bacterium]|nr:Tm-1-like ATP-binding domain-containing protein [Actinomycetota bacterium]
MSGSGPQTVRRPPAIVLVGTLDTKGHEYAYLRDRIRDAGGEAILVDAGVLGEPQVHADISREEVARAAGADHAELARAADRGQAVEAMGHGAREVLSRLYAEGVLQGAAAVGGSGNSSIAAAAMRDLPIGVPKLIVSTVASGDTRPYVGAKDLTMMYSVVDIAGINQISSQILANAAGAIVGMTRAGSTVAVNGKPLVGATMFGVTTAGVDRARERLEELGYEVLVFHATGTGGQSFEALATGGFLAGALDMTTTELADELVGGVLSAGPDRLEAVGRSGIPQVVSLGALDMVNFGPADSVPDKFAERNLYVHNPMITLMRTTPAENAELGRQIGRKLNAADSPTALFVPLGGVSAIDVEGQPFHDPEADAALFHSLRKAIDPNKVEVHEVDANINDPAFATAMAERLHELIEERR